MLAAFVLAQLGLMSALVSTGNRAIVVPSDARIAMSPSLLAKK